MKKYRFLQKWQKIQFFGNILERFWPIWPKYQKRPFPQGLWAKKDPKNTILRRKIGVFLMEKSKNWFFKKSQKNDKKWQKWAFFSQLFSILIRLFDFGYAGAFCCFLTITKKCFKKTSFFCDFCKKWQNHKNWWNFLCFLDLFLTVFGPKMAWAQNQILRTWVGKTGRFGKISHFFIFWGFLTPLKTAFFYKIKKIRVFFQFLAIFYPKK
mgnify:CR=1 FL=1